jgi:hypothetical protein
MAEMKPLLEGGMPIPGAIIVMADGKPVQKHVALVMGRETRIDGTDDGVYSITPSLNQDGTIKYDIKLVTKDPVTGLEKTITISSLVQTPWGNFTLSLDSGQVMAFDPDQGGP